MGIDKSKNPFVQIWADYYPDYESFISDFSERIITVIPEFFDHPNVFLYGGSGTGKTMLFRYLSFEIQLNHYLNQETQIPTLSRFLDFSSKKIKRVQGRGIKFIGIYYKLTHMPLKDFRLICKSIYQEQKFFEFYLDLEISIKFLTAINKLLDFFGKTGGASNIKSKVMKCVKRHSNIGVSYSIEQILEKLSDKKRKVDLYLSEAWINTEASKELGVNVGGLSRLYLNLAETLKSEAEEFKNVKFYILLDEYEGIEEHFKIAVNSIIRERNPFLEHKINSRRYGITTFATQTKKDFIIVDRDVKLVDLELLFRRRKSHYKNLLLDIARKRLEQVSFFAEKNLSDIRKILEAKAPEEEARSILVKEDFGEEAEHRKRFREFLRSYNVYDINKTMDVVKCDQNPLVEKLNMLLVKRRIAYQGKKVAVYSNDKIKAMSDHFLEKPIRNSTFGILYEKNKLALLFQLVHEYGKHGKRKIYCGFDTFLALSGGFVAFFLQLCYQAWEYASDEGFIALGFGKIDAESQTRAAEKIAWDFLESEIRNIDKVGNDIYYFVLNTGTFFRGLHLDELIREPEPTYFNTKTASLTEKSQQLIKIAHCWSALQTKIPMKPKSSEEVLPDVHILHPILAPAFQISYRTRGRTPLLPEEVDYLFTGTEVAVRYLLNKYRSRYLAGPSRSKHQKNLFGNG